jgi:methyltransferase (TIGR00027 family)
MRAWCFADTWGSMRGSPSRTAEWMCLARALEQRRPVALRIVDDPLAGDFLGPFSRSVQVWGRSWLGSNLFPATLLHYILARQRFTDEHLAAALAVGVDQLVVVGAGYDTRAWRFADQLAVAFEVDHPDTAARKTALLEGLDLPAVDRRAIAADLAVADLEAVLLDAGFDRSRPAFFAWEGVTMYLSREAVLRTLGTVHGLMAPGSGLTLDLWWDSGHAGAVGALWRVAPAVLGALGESLHFQCRPEDSAALLAQAGLAVTEVLHGRALDHRYVPDQRRVFENCCLVHAEPGPAL